MKILIRLKGFQIAIGLLGKTVKKYESDEHKVRLGTHFSFLFDTKKVEIMVSLFGINRTSECSQKIKNLYCQLNKLNDMTVTASKNANHNKEDQKKIKHEIAYHREKTKNRLVKEYTQIGRDIMVHGFSRNSSWLKFEVFKRTLHVTCYTLFGFRENKGKDKADLRSETTD